jgi:hypothetical protein
VEMKMSVNLERSGSYCHSRQKSLAIDSLLYHLASKTKDTGTQGTCCSL